MCDTNAIGDFDLNLVKIRKPLEFPDESVQSTAYTGAGGVPTLNEVLVAGSSANNLDITEVGRIECDEIQFSNDLTIQTTAAPITRWLAYSESVSSISLTDSSISSSPVTIYTSPTLALAGQYQLCAVLKLTTDGTATNLLLREQPVAFSGTLSNNDTQLVQYINTDAFFPSISAYPTFFSTWTMTITTTAPNTIVNVSLRAYWNGGNVTLSSGCSYQLTYLGYSGGA